jgi:transposase
MREFSSISFNNNACQIVSTSLSAGLSLFFTGALFLSDAGRYVLPTYSSEMNPTEHLWAEIRYLKFNNITSQFNE